MSDIKLRVKGKVKFTHYHDGNLWYVYDDGYKFPVPINDCSSAIFQAEDKAILFMRWIKQHMKTSFRGEAVHFVS